MDPAEPISLGHRVRLLAAERGDDIALVHVDPDGADDHVLTFAQVDRRSEQVAHALAARGLGPGDRLGIGLENSPELVLSALAAWKLGAVPVPMRWDLPDWELDRVRATIDSAVHLGRDDLDRLRATEHEPTAPVGTTVSPAAWGICSSGSSGTPKVIVSGRPGVWLDAYVSCLMEQWRPVPRPQRVLVLAPMYHANAFTTLLNLLAGDTVVVLRRFDAATAVDAIERHRISTFVATPTMLKRIADLDDIDTRDLSSIDWVLQGAAKMPDSLVRRWLELLAPDQLVMAYGMSEGIGLTALRGDEWLEHPGSIGLGRRGTEFRVMRDGQPCAAGEVGEIWLRTPGPRSYHYLGDAAPLPTDDDGFETAGDLGYTDPDGYLYIVDRRDDLIVSGGANVYPAEVEAALSDHPRIADIVVVGLQDPEWGRRVHAIVEPHDPAIGIELDELVAYAKGRLAPYKVPKSLELVPSIPRSAATKINRRALVDARGG